MKTTIKSWVMVILGVGLFVTGCAKKNSTGWTSINNLEVAAQLKSFVAEKEAQADTTTNKMPSGFKTFFAAAEKNDWLAVSNQFGDFRNHAGQYLHSGKTDERLRGTAWETVKEIWGAFYDFNVSGEKYSAAFGNDIIDSIPPGSIYFGGTDPGRFIVTALEKSQVDGDPFFTLTQNALADGSYLDYVRSMYGDRIYVPTADDLQKCFEDYLKGVTRRQQKNQLKPGEDVTKDSNGRIQVSGQVAVMEVNGLLVKTIFDKNTNHEFYIEESFPLDWMYRYLEPHGLIMKINRQPLAELSDGIVQRDSDYWTKYMTPLIGGWLKPDTTIGEVADFAEKIHAKKDLSGFTGDLQFVQNRNACIMFCKLRSSIGGVYAWRAQHSTGGDEKKLMNDAADFAFRQSFALCPYSPEAVFRYVNLLLSENRVTEAVLIAETAAKISEINQNTNEQSDSNQFDSLVEQLKQYQKQLSQRQDAK